MNTRQYRGDERVAAQIEKRFGVPAWEWARLKIVFEASRMEDEFAADLIQRIDRGELSNSGAYIQLRKRDADEQVVGSMSSVNLEELLNQVLRAESFFKTIEVALRCGLPVRVGKLTPEQIAELPAVARSAATKLKSIATHLPCTTTGGLNTDGDESEAPQAQ